MKKPKLSDQEKGLLKLKNDPALFVQELLGAKLVTWQTGALHAVRDHDRVAVKSGHGVGNHVSKAGWFCGSYRPITRPRSF